MVESWMVKIPELSGDLERRVYVYLPDYYGEDEQERFPVLYMFDGHNLFFDEDATYGKSWGLKEYMDFTETPLIIVGIECNHGEDFARLKEYSPYCFSEPGFGYIKGLGRLSMNWIIHELKPYIDETYRTFPERECTFIAGSSMGGLMSLYAVTKYNRYFSRAAALSPSIWVCRNKMYRLFANADIRDDTVVYMDYGKRELENHEGMLECFRKSADILMERGVNVTARIVPNGEHCEACWEKQLPLVFDTLLYEEEIY